MAADPSLPPKPTGESALERGLITAAILRRALELQHLIFEAASRWTRLGEILAIRGDLGEDDLPDLLGTALFPGEPPNDPPEELAGEIALKSGVISAEQFLECLRAQADARRRREPHRPIGPILLEKGYARREDLDACAAALASAAPARDAAPPAGRAPERPPITPLDAQYIQRGRAGELPAKAILDALTRIEKLHRVLGRRMALWEALLAREVVTPRAHVAILEETCNVRDPSYGSWLLGGILIELGYAGPGDVEAVLAARLREAAQPGAGPVRPIGERLVERGIVSRAEVEEALRVQALRRKAGR
jgi:hypothetical protein